VDRWEAAKKQSRKKWTDGRQLRNKAEKSGEMGLDGRQLRNKVERSEQMGGS
jgi:hypothetical protein